MNALAATVAARRAQRGLAKRFAAAVALLGLMLALGADGRTFMRVTFPSLDHDAAGAALVLNAILLLPDGPMPAGGFPAIVALHGCSGMYSSLKGRQDQLSERLMARADLLLNEGYAIVFPDSFGARGRKEICTAKPGEHPVPVAKRKLDALGALAFVGARRDIARDRIALVGWSHGGSAALAAINARDSDVIAFRDHAGAPPWVRAAVAFYPGCRSTLAAGDRFEPGAPTRILIGELDDWTPAKPCIDLGAAMAARGEPLRVIVFPGAQHGFDAPGSTVVHRADVPNGVNPGKGVHVGPEPGTREKANSKLRAFLDEHLRRRSGD